MANQFFDTNYRKKLKYGSKSTSVPSFQDNDPLFIGSEYPERIDNAVDDIRKVISHDFGESLLNNTFKNNPVIKSAMIARINETIDKKGYKFLNTSARYQFVNNFIINLTGFGILQPLMDDPAITEIYVIEFNKIYVKKKGKKVLTDIKFKDRESVKNYIDAILAPLNRRVDILNPIEDARLPNGDRVAISGDAISPQGFSFNIRKFKREKMTMNDLVSYKTINSKMADLLKLFMKIGLNAIVSGGTDSGKTSTLNALADFIRDDRMITSVEDNIEIQLQKPLWLQVEARHANIDGRGEVTLADALKHFLRRSPDIIIVGEIRDGDVGQVFLQAVNTGHTAYTTIHANSPELCRQRLCNLVVSKSEFKYETVLNDFNKAVNIIIQLEKFNDLNRIIMMNISYVDPLNGSIVDLVKFDHDTNDWVFNPLPNTLLELISKFENMEKIR